jgi:hypothetical protein
MSEMTISQALRQSKKIKGQLAKLQSRASAAVSYQKTQLPAFNFGVCLEEHLVASGQLVELGTRIELTNAATRIDWEGKKISLSQAIRILNDLKSKIAWLGTLPVRTQEITSEQEVAYLAGQHTTVSIEWKCELPEAARVKLVDETQAKFDRLNDIVETANGRTSLLSA